jgi:hypothetical protein
MPPPLPPRNEPLSSKSNPLDLFENIVSLSARIAYWGFVLFAGVRGISEDGLMSLILFLVLGLVFYEPFCRLFPFRGSRR